MTQTKYRTHTCGELRMENVGQTVTVAGWLENLREVGSNLGFLVLRDMHGVTQVVIETEEMMAQVKAIKSRWCPAKSRCWAAAATTSCPLR